MELKDQEIQIHKKTILNLKKEIKHFKLNFNEQIFHTTKVLKERLNEKENQLSNLQVKMNQKPSKNTHKRSRIQT